MPIMRRYYTMSEFANLVGITRQSVYSRVKKGTLVLDTCDVGGRQKKLVDISNNGLFGELCDKLGTKKALELRADWPPPNELIPSQRIPPPAKKIKKLVKKPKPVKRVEPEEDTCDANSGQLPDVDEVSIPKDIRGFTKEQMERVKIYFQALREKIRGEEQRGTLMPRKLMSRFLHSVWAVHRSQIRTMNHRLAPDICAALGDDAPARINIASKIIEQEEYLILSNIKRVLKDALAELQESPDLSDE